MAFAELLSLIYPINCVVCAAGSQAICPKCEFLFQRNRVRYRIEDVPLYSALFYEEVVAKLVLAAKENNDRMARKYLASLIALRFSALHRELNAESYVFVPIPSSAKSNRRRGFLHTHKLALEVIREIEPDVRTCELLILNRKIEDQTKLDRNGRHQNLVGAYSVRLPGNPAIRKDVKDAKDLADVALKTDLGGEKGLGIILIDDLVTTGSSMREAIRALKSAGITPHGMLSACVTGRNFANKIGPSGLDERG